MKKTILGFMLGLMAFTSVTVWTPPASADTYTPAQVQQIEELKKAYPLDTCPVSGEKLDGSMGKPIDYLYTTKTADGKESTRLVRFCCPSCLRKFKKDPQPTLKVLDDAAAKKSGNAAPASGSSVSVG